jgi:signal transduction histidine kinase
LEELRVTLAAAQLVVFFGAGVAAFRVWLQHRSRPAAFLAVAFATLGLTLIVNRSFPPHGAGEDLPIVRDLVIVGLAAFPWLLALFAWSFEPRFPRWLPASGGAVVLLGLWTFWSPGTAFDLGPRTMVETAFVSVFIGVWVVLAGAAAVHLWCAGDTQPLVRARMRLMSVGALVLTAALLLAGSVPTGSNSSTPTLAAAMSVVSALLFLAGFAPPRPLRVWWRGRVTAAWQQMQLELISATTAEEAARAVAPVVADLLGGGAAIVADDGEVLAVARISRSAAADAAARIVAGEPPAPGDEIVGLDSVSMVIRPTSYTPLFGQDERDLVNGFAGQLRLALDRAQLFSAEERGRHELQRARDEEQAMIMGLAHDLRGSSSTLGGYTNLLRASRDEAEREEIMTGIEASSSHLEALVGSLLDLGRVGANRPRAEPVDLAPVVDEVVGRMEPMHPEVSFHRGALPTVAGDRLELVQVFENLLVNAVRHGGEGARTITLTSEAGDATVTIHVRDDGQGVDASDRASIFSLFHRGRSAGGLGSGVGLNLVRRIVEAHQGTIELMDNDPGAHFRLCFPVPTWGLDRDEVSAEA